jgi:hypothetical protein
MRRAVIWAVPALLILLNGCGSDSKVMSGTGGAGGSSGGGTGGGAAGTSGGGSGGTGGGLAACGTRTDPNSGDACNNVDPVGPCVMTVPGTGTPPTAMGGQIVAGTYELTSRTAFNAPDGGNNEDPRRETVVVTGSGNSFTIQISQLSGTTRERQSATVTTSGTQLTYTPNCPPPGDGGDNGGTTGYSANATSFTIFDVGGNGTLRPSVYTKR